MAKKTRKMTFYGAWKVFFHLSMWALTIVIATQFGLSFGWPLLQAALMSALVYPVVCAALWYVWAFEAQTEAAHSQQNAQTRNGGFEEPTIAEVISGAVLPHQTMGHHLDAVNPNSRNLIDRLP